MTNVAASLFYIFVAISCAAALNVELIVEQELERFARENGLETTQLAVMRRERLVLAKTTHCTTSEHASHHAPLPSDTMPVQDVSKLVTAIATLQLVDDGHLGLDSPVFGPRGVLWRLQPTGGDSDERLADVTIAHLLAHTAGWDEALVPSEESSDLRSAAVNRTASIRHMMSQPLLSTPGTQRRHSHFGYTVLGEVIEHVTGKSYFEQVRDSVLRPAGMWQTKAVRGVTRRKRRIGQRLRSLSTQGDQLLYTERLDSTLGLQSNVFDVSRLLAAVFQPTSNAKLFKNSEIEHALKHLFKNPEASELLGLEIARDSLHLHSASPLFQNTVHLTKSLENSAQSDDVTILVMTSGLVAKEKLAPLLDALMSLNLRRLTSNAYVSELSDVTLEGDGEQVLVKTHLHEHKLAAFDAAMRMAGFSVSWLHGYSHNAGHELHTYFACIYRRASQPIELQYEIFKSASVACLTRFVSLYSTLNYHVDLMQTFRSQSQGHVVHVVVMRRLETPKYALFNVATDYAMYRQDLLINRMDGYEVTVQSIEQVAGEKRVTYSMQKHLQQTQERRTRVFDTVTVQELAGIHEQQQQEGYSLLYVDTYKERDGQMLSVVFEPNSEVNSSTDVAFAVSSTDLANKLRQKSSEGFLPTILVSLLSEESPQWLIHWRK